MRVIGAGLFVFAGVLLMVALVGSQKALNWAPSWLKQDLMGRGGAGA